MLLPLLKLQTYTKREKLEKGVSCLGGAPPPLICERVMRGMARRAGVGALPRGRLFMTIFFLIWLAESIIFQGGCGLCGLGTTGQGPGTDQRVGYRCRRGLAGEAKAAQKMFVEQKGGGVNK